MTNPAIEAFVQEANDILETLEDQLLELEGSSDPAQVDAVFRALHTIKGSGSMFGFTRLSQFTHHFETAFDLIREGKLAIDGKLIDLSLKARDTMRRFVDLGGDNAEADQLSEAAEVKNLVAALQSLTNVTSAPETTEEGASQAGAASEIAVFDIWFKPAADDLRNGLRPDLLLGELEDLGDVTHRLDLTAVPSLEKLEPLQCYAAWAVTLTGATTEEAIKDVFIFADDSELEITKHEPPVAASEPELTTKTVAADKGKSNKTTAPIRVDSGRLDEVMDRLGELVIAQARLNQVTTRLADPMLEAVTEDIERLLTGLRDTTLSIRMMPIETVFGKFRRVVRDLSAELNKDIKLVTKGGETEIDKNVIDKLSEPLVHMIRNAIDHGVETREGRIEANKPEHGTVILSANQEGGEVLISLEDDGRGLNTEAIRARAIERGLLDANATPTEQELHQFIFAPGFSTAKELTSISGRGVGMDAVKTTVDSLRGNFKVHSQPGQGTKVTLHLPVSLAIIDGMLVRLGSDVFVIPLSAVQECVELDTLETNRESGRSMLRIRETLVPFLDLVDVFNYPESKDTRRRVVIVRAGNAPLGLIVDDILGQNQTVIKALSVYHRDVEGFAGATILGDGTVALIIDTAIMIRRALQQAKAQEAPSKYVAAGGH
ncbi:chemotaxis protein CheA [Roseobacter weihaiensis]|uniref:chemotaxis protein CheA n=1 Tax=Roseobacter weihaiensis TaxID=2763262 RepID=UPI001D0AA70E|nr:chemotaxis protein CheA [Roseobacter sp. H9]